MFGAKSNFHEKFIQYLGIPNSLELVHIHILGYSQGITGESLVQTQSSTLSDDVNFGSPRAALYVQRFYTSLAEMILGLTYDKLGSVPARFPRLRSVIVNLPAACLIEGHGELSELRALKILRRVKSEIEQRKAVCCLRSTAYIQIRQAIAPNIELRTPSGNNWMLVSECPDDFPPSIVQLSNTKEFKLTITLSVGWRHNRTKGHVWVDRYNMS